MSCPMKVNNNTIEITAHTSCYCILDLLCISMKKLGETGDAEQTAKLFSDLMKQALDECAPTKIFTIKRGYKTELKLDAKQSIKVRDQASIDLRKTLCEKKILLEKHKKLRNKSKSQIRNDTIAA